MIIFGHIAMEHLINCLRISPKGKTMRGMKRNQNSSYLTEGVVTQLMRHPPMRVYRMVGTVRYAT